MVVILFSFFTGLYPKFQLLDNDVILFAYRGGDDVGPNWTDRGRNGSKIHTLVDKFGIPLSFILTAANYPDSRSVPYITPKLYKIRPPRYQQHMNLDSVYDTRVIKEMLLARIKGIYIHHIPINRRKSRRSIQRMSEEDKVHRRHRIKHQYDKYCVCIYYL